MHEHILHVVAIGLAVVFSAQSGQALVAEVGLDWIKAFDQNVQPKVKLLLIDKYRRLDVPLY